MDSWDVLRRNLTALFDACKDGLRSGPHGALQLEAVTGIGKSTIYRILDAREKNPTQLDTLEAIAAAYNLQPWQLLVPRLDPIDPPIPVGQQRFAVLRSVFVQTQQAAGLDALDSRHGRLTSPDAGSEGARDTRDRVPAGGPPAGGTRGPDTVLGPRPRRNKRQP